MDAISMSPSISQNELQYRYAAVIHALESLQFATKDDNKIIVVDDCIKTMDTIQEVISRKVNENYLPDLLMNEFATPRKEGILSPPQNTSTGFSASPLSQF